MQVTFNVTGRDIVNALKAGKSVVVHALHPDGYEEYVVPSSIVFNETADFFRIELALDETHITFIGSLDDPIEYNSSSSGGDIK